MKSDTESKENPSYTLDQILEVIGKFGPYHIAIFAMILFSITMTGSFALGFIFTASELKYRCRVSECDSDVVAYNASWVKNAVPFDKDLPKSCIRYEHLNVSSGLNDTCLEKSFNQNVEVECEDVVFDDYENTIVKEVKRVVY